VTTMLEDHKQEIRELVGGILEIDPADLGDEDSFRDDHSADSMRSIEILAALELKYDISIDQSELPSMGTLAGVYEAVGKAAGWQ
jgi:acyl carrier protein